MTHQTVVIVDFGGQYSQLVAKKVRLAGVYCEIVNGKTSALEIKKKNPIGIILSGGELGERFFNPSDFDKDILNLGVPCLAICYGACVMSYALGFGTKEEKAKKEIGFISPCTESSLFKSAGRTEVAFSKGKLKPCFDDSFVATATSEELGECAFENKEKGLYAVLFHAEYDDFDADFVIKSFLFDVVGAKGDWTMEDFIEFSVEEVRKQVGDQKVILALSGGVDSSVLAKLLSKAIGKQLTCIFVDTGLMRKNEGDEVEAAFSDGSLNFIRVNAEDRFLGKLKGVTNPEEKRKIVGEEFIRVFEEEALKIGDATFLAQGTIYADIFESQTGNGVIKSHHNVGGLPETLNFKGLVEPLKMLFKAEVRELGRILGLPAYLYQRQPFPGPGLSVRCIGEVTKERLDILRDADFIFREEIERAGLNKEISQYFAVLTPMKSVGVSKDSKRTYDFTLALRAIKTTDFMTAIYYHIPYEVLDVVTERIIDEVKGINRICYDITGKPPATIEWE